MNEYPQTNERPPAADHGDRPFVGNIEHLTCANPYFRATLWTGPHLQVTLMCIPAGGEIGLEIHSDVDQFLRIESGCALVQMGESRDALTFKQKAGDNDAVIVPAGTWHNLKNAGDEPLKLYSIYAPPEHPFGTVHRTKAEADAAEHH